MTEFSTNTIGDAIFDVLKHEKIIGIKLEHNVPIDYLNSFTELDVRGPFAFKDKKVQVVYIGLKRNKTIENALKMALTKINAGIIPDAVKGDMFKIAFENIPILEIKTAFCLQPIIKIPPVGSLVNIAGYLAIIDYITEQEVSVTYEHDGLNVIYTKYNFCKLMHNT